MSFVRGQAIEVTETARVRMVGSAFKKTGSPVVLVPLGKGVHAGHLALVQAAQRIRGGVVVVAVDTEDPADITALQAAQVDYLWRYTEEQLWPGGMRTLVQPGCALLSDAAEISLALTRHLALIGALGPSDVVVGEKDYELLIALNQAVRDLHINTRVQGVPTVRMPDGLALSLRNRKVEPSEREKASGLSAAL
ncbi:MAG: pantoate--beta-alanine ligase, partial [Corynebacterium sp.]|nr:pantoate--beta-alanine ligase [Corynebacterium sp.]